MGTASTMTSIVEALAWRCPARPRSRRWTRPHAWPQLRRTHRADGLGRPHAAVDLTRGLPQRRGGAEALGGSTMPRLHMIAMARGAGVDLTPMIGSRRRLVPVLANCFRRRTVEGRLSLRRRPAGIDDAHARTSRSASVASTAARWRKPRGCEVLDDEVIRPLDKPGTPTARWRCCAGKLAPKAR